MCPTCGSENAVVKTYCGIEPHGERSEGEFLECLDCGEKFEEFDFMEAA